MTEAHKPKYQNASVGRFCVCACDWRSSFGDRKQVEGEYKNHLRLAGVEA